MRILFMGSPAFSVPVLEALLAAGHEVAAVWSQPPRPSGRGQKLTPTPVHAAAQARGIPVFTPKSLRSDEEQAQFARFGADVAVVVAYGLILPQPVLDAPRLGCLNIHASLLPRWRGAAPIQRAILAGDSITGVQIMQMEAGLDTGPVYATATTRIDAGDTGTSLHDRLSALGASLITETLPGIADGSLKPVPQAEAGLTYAAKIDRAETKVDWTRPAAEVDRQIRAFADTPGAWCLGPDGKRLKLLGARVSPQSVPLDVTAGTVLSGGPSGGLCIACGDGHAVEILHLQREGAKALAAREYQRGGPPLLAGTLLV